MKTNTGKQGFSVIELMVAITATAILVLIVGLLLLMPYRTMRANREYAQLRRDVTEAVRAMAKDIRPYALSDVDVSQNDGFILNYNAGPPVRQKVEYKLENGALNRYVNDANQGAVIEDGLTLFTSSMNAYGGVVLSIRIQSSSGDVTLSHQTSIHTRN